jgi:protocatechuate 3,4-dioxygenase beta subunit
MLTATAADPDSAQARVIRSTRLDGVRRRGLLGASLAMAGAALTGLTPAFGQNKGLRPTAPDDLGPFYPIGVPADQDFDLTAVAGVDGHPLGQLLYVQGRVLDLRGEPVADAVIEIWQANAAGRYAHPGDDSEAPLDPNFQGYAKIRTGADGSYRFKTIKPGDYGSRTPHIHFDIRGRQSRLITQMYFEGEPKNATDGLLKDRSPEARKTLIARAGAPTGAQESTALVANWDVVLVFG